MVPSGSSEVNLRTPKQVQRRLKTAEIVELVADYQTGIKVKNLAARYGINRNTVIRHINRARLRRHYPALVSAATMEAAPLYRSSWSLAAIGGHFGVNASTVRTALLRAGVAMRDCQGRER